MSVIEIRHHIAPDTSGEVIEVGVPGSPALLRRKSHQAGLRVDPGGRDGKGGIDRIALQRGLIAIFRHVIGEDLTLITGDIETSCPGPVTGGDIGGI